MYRRVIYNSVSSILNAAVDDGHLRGNPCHAEHGMHALRHFYASVLLDAGENVKALSHYLGHTDPGFTLRVYTHLMPSSDGRARRAVDALYGTAQDGPAAGSAAHSHGPETTQGR